MKTNKNEHAFLSHFHSLGTPRDLGLRFQMLYKNSIIDDVQ